ncbi:MAG: hypothetical protein ACI97N_001883, partial [Cognaticolwellia sp.]
LIKYGFGPYKIKKVHHADDYRYDGLSYILTL